MGEYFSGLNYSLSNEDSNIEAKILDQLSINNFHILSVCGAGSRVIPLMKRQVSSIHVVDISELQIKLFRLRYASLKALNFQDFLHFWGYQNQGGCRKEMLQSFLLPNNEQEFWLHNSNAWEKGFLFLGKWEKHLLRLGQLFRHLFLTNFEGLFLATNPEERQRWYQDHFPQKRLFLFLKTFANPLVFNLLLYRGRFAPSNEDFAEFLNRVFHKILIEKDPKKSFFAQMLFLGDLRYAEGWPAEAQESVFNEAKDFQGKIIECKNDLAQVLNTKDFKFLSLSDVASYLDADALIEFEKGLLRQLEQSATAVVRSFRRHPQFSEKLNHYRVSKLETQSEEHDSIGVYKFHIFSDNYGK